MTEIVISGAAETEQLGRIPDLSVLDLNVSAGLAALADAGLTIGDVDGVAGAYSPHTVAHALGVQPRWFDGTNVGGCSFLLHVRHAAAAIRCGDADTVLITHGESGRSRVGTPPRPADPASLHGQFEAPYGAIPPYTRFTLPALRYMARFGVSHEQLATVAVAQRAWARRNPRAQRRDPLTVEDVLASPLIAYPFHQPQCCVVTDGGGALVLQCATGANGPGAVRVLGAGEAYETPLIAQMPDLTASGAATRAARDAYADAGFRPADVDHVMSYDAFAHLPLYGLEALGIVGRGEAASFIEDGHTVDGGAVPTNTNGGGLSYTHTGMYGMFAIQEAVRQLRGTAAAQVLDRRCSAVLGFGGMFAAAAVLLLGAPERLRTQNGAPA